MPPRVIGKKVYLQAISFSRLSKDPDLGGIQTLEGGNNKKKQGNL
jgi:hypothetical protein